MSRNEGEMWPSFTFYQYRIKLAKAIDLKSGRYECRDGILVRCAARGCEGWGEIAPLDGYSPDTFADVVNALPALKQRLLEPVTLTHELPSVQSGIGFAKAAYDAARDRGSLYLHWGGLPERSHIPIARLILDSEPGAIVESVGTALKEGSSCIKMKVGLRSVSEDIALIRRVQSMLPVGASLRLDANRRWTLSEALTFAKGISSAGIAFIEEPLQSLSDYSTYDREQQLPFALDESLHMSDRNVMSGWKNLTSIVLKPMLLGGPDVVLDWIRWASSRSISSVVSSMFETGVGICGLIAFSAAFAADTPAGLDTYGYLDDDTIHPRIRFSRGKVAIYQSFPKSWAVNVSALEEI